MELFGLGAVLSFFGAVVTIACGVMLGNFGTYLVKETWLALDDAFQRAWRYLLG